MLWPHTKTPIVFDKHRSVKASLKHEARNSKSETNLSEDSQDSNDKNPKFKTFWSFGNLNFDIVSYFGF